MLHLFAQTFPSIPDAPKSWTDPAAFGYVVFVLVVAFGFVMWARAKFEKVEVKVAEHDKRLDRQGARQDLTLLHTVPPTATGPLGSNRPVPDVTTRPTHSTETP
jgi:hypothetical protein